MRRRHPGAEDAARSLLHRLATLAAQARATRVFIEEHGREPGDDALGAFLERLRAELATRRAASGGRPPGTYEPAGVRIVRDPVPALRYHERTLVGSGGPLAADPDDVVLFLLGWNDGPLRWARWRGDRAVPGERAGRTHAGRARGHDRPDPRSARRRRAGGADRAAAAAGLAVRAGRARRRAVADRRAGRRSRRRARRRRRGGARRRADRVSGHGVARGRARHRSGRAEARAQRRRVLSRDAHRLVRAARSPRAVARGSARLPRLRRSVRAPLVDLGRLAHGGAGVRRAARAHRSPGGLLRRRRRRPRRRRREIGSTSSRGACACASPARATPA